MTDTEHNFLSMIEAPSPTSAADGRATLKMDADEGHLNAAGTVHGGMLATLVDTTMGAAIQSVAEDETPATSQLTVTYLRPGKPGPLTVTATVHKRGARLAVCEAEVEQDGQSLVHALATFALTET